MNFLNYFNVLFKLVYFITRVYPIIIHLYIQYHLHQ